MIAGMTDQSFMATNTGKMLAYAVMDCVNCVRQCSDWLNQLNQTVFP